MAINIDSFKRQALDGFARPNLFTVTFDASSPLSTFGSGMQSVAALPFTCRAASVPASTVGTIELSYQGRKVKVAGDRTYAEWVITVMNNETFDLRNRFEQWSDMINAHELNVRTKSKYNISGGSTYKFDGTIHTLDKTGEIISEYKMVGGFPSDISAMETSWELNNTIQEFTVTLQYDYVIPVKNFLVPKTGGIKPPSI